MQTTVVNRKYHKPTADDISIMRPNLLGNPFHVGWDGSREEVISLFEQWVRRSPRRMQYIKTLRGKTLVCCCKPKACHGDVIARIAEEKE